MNFADIAYLGIDPTSGSNTFTYAALDRELNLILLEEGGMEGVASFLEPSRAACVAVNAPASVNRGTMRAKLEREMRKPHQIRGAELRLAESQLRERGIAVAGTPSSVPLCAAWVQLGFEIYRQLETMGYKKYPQRDSASQYMETHPHACYCVMAGNNVLSKSSLEGRLQRQLLLFARGVRIPDPMDFFEEVTRYKLTRGIWPVELLYPPEQLDAIVAAYTAWLAVNKADQVLSIGDAAEGMIVLPVPELKERY